MKLIRHQDWFFFTPIIELSARGFAFAGEALNASDAFLAEDKELENYAAHLPARIHIFADNLTRNLACLRANPGVFNFVPMSAEQAIELCRGSFPRELAIGPSMSGPGFNAVVDNVLEKIVQVGRATWGDKFMVQIDQIDFEVTINAQNVVTVKVDDTFSRRPEKQMNITREWLEATLEILLSNGAA